MVKEIIVVIFILVAVINFGIQLHNFLKNKKDTPLNTLKIFIESDEIKQAVEDIICNILYQVDFSKYNSFMDAQAEVFNIAYDEIWKYVQGELHNRFGEDKLYSAILKTATRSFIEEYVNSVFLSENIQEQLVEELQIQVNNETEDIIKEEQELEKEANKYEMDEFDDEGYTVDELDPCKINGKDEGELYNPPSEDDEDYSDNDDSVEVIQDDKTEIDLSVELTNEDID